MSFSLEHIVKTLKENKAKPEAAFVFAQALGASFILTVRAVREAYGLTLEAAKEVGVRATTNLQSLKAYQAMLMDAVEAIEPRPAQRRRHAHS